ncbi:hypothetical protein HMN09_00211800 [Mycena chlorophos]|uniref:Uncharacterized protein n=1 Tax=Mycena chlorophos TaxID=658473 RepID=A0A8H6WNG4_MYCCL|nr:hypothetical protein HMN09_00211800 [Mycena chlorophos]
MASNPLHERRAHPQPLLHPSRVRRNAPHLSIPAPPPALARLPWSRAQILASTSMQLPRPASPRLNHRVPGTPHMSSKARVVEPTLAAVWMGRKTTNGHQTRD